MPSPEISHRCRKCGASVRAHARYCPQCGRDVGAEEDEQTPPSAAARRAVDHETHSGGVTNPLSRRDRRRSDAVSPVEPSRKPAIVPHADQPAVAPQAPPPTAPSTLPPTAPSTSSSPPPPHASQPIAAPSRRAVTAPPSRRPTVVIADNSPHRAERLRESSITFLEEAADDSGLRFVLIGITLFIIFLVFLFFSTVIT
ncbi:MAG: zinc ribbon domain-containing protein [Acidobacteriota bacterium]|nr:zinc ribbon domain-containing protein [Acidobacteriota bacterium]